MAEEFLEEEGRGPFPETTEVRLFVAFELTAYIGIMSNQSSRKKRGTLTPRRSG